MTANKEEKYYVISIIHLEDDDEDEDQMRLGRLFEFECHETGQKYAEQLLTIKEEAFAIVNNDFLTPEQSFSHWTTWYDNCNRFIKDVGPKYVTVDIRVQFHSLRMNKLFKPTVKFGPHAGRVIGVEPDEIATYREQQGEVVDIDF